MSVDPAWISFWQTVLTVGLGSFFVVVLVVIPLGARDIKRLFAQLDAARDEIDNEDDRETDALPPTIAGG